MIALYLSSYNCGQYKPSAANREVPEQILDNFKVWSFQASLLRLLHILLGLVATICSVLVAMDLKHIDAERKKWLAFSAAVSFSILSAFDLGDKANRTRTAWREMNTALIKYQEGVDTSKAKLIDMYEQAEMTIGDVKPNPNASNNSQGGK